MKRVKQSSDVLLKNILSMHVPASYLEFFELDFVVNIKDCWDLVLIEREDLIPENLRNETVVLDGFCNSISILTHPFSLKKIYLAIKRHRWKLKGGSQHYSNSYELHEKGIKITAEYAAFLKGGH